MPTRPPPSKASRPGSGRTEDLTTAGAANEFVARIRISRTTGPKFRTVKLLSPYTVASGSPTGRYSQSVQRAVFGQILSPNCHGLEVFQRIAFRVCNFLHIFAIISPFRALGAGFGPIRYLEK